MLCQFICLLCHGLWCLFSMRSFAELEFTGGFSLIFSSFILFYCLVSTVSLKASCFNLFKNFDNMVSFGCVDFFSGFVLAGLIFPSFIVLPLYDIRFFCIVVDNNADSFCSMKIQLHGSQRYLFVCCIRN